MHHHERRRALVEVLRVLVQAQQLLLIGLVVAVLQEDGDELQRVAVRDRRAAGALVDQIELVPRPPGADARRFHLPAFHLAFDRRVVESRLAGGRRLRIGQRDPARTSAADHVHRIQEVGAEAERPQQACRRDAGEDLVVVAPVAHLHVILTVDRAAEFRRGAGKRFLGVVARDRRVRREPALATRPRLQVERADVRRLPELGVLDRGEAFGCGDGMAVVARAEAHAPAAEGEDGGDRDRGDRRSHHERRGARTGPRRVTPHTPCVG